MNTMRIAIPSQTSDGLISKRSEHFGQCKLFTLVDLCDEKITRIQHVENAEHGSCMQPVELLREHGVNSIIVSGIGARPLQGFANAGITVFYAPREFYKDINSLLGGMMRQEFSLIKPEQACQGHGSCHV
jgi:predicted Fe-Mo cluster-binding NifX family protein